MENQTTTAVVTKTRKAKAAVEAPATRVVENAERHEVYKLARAAKLSVEVASKVSFDYRDWAANNPTATSEQLAAKAQELITPALAVPVAQ
jgi:hypothetical protein